MMKEFGIIRHGLLARHAQETGNDLVFIDYYGNQLNHEIEFFHSPYIPHELQVLNPENTSFRSGP